MKRITQNGARSIFPNGNIFELGSDELCQSSSARTVAPLGVPVKNGGTDSEVDFAEARTEYEMTLKYSQSDALNEKIRAGMAKLDK